MNKVFIMIPFAIAACAGQPEPIQNYNAPLVKFEASDEWIRCPQDTLRWPSGLYRAGTDPRIACRDRTGLRSLVHISTPPTEEPPNEEPPQCEPPKKKPPTSKPPKEESVRRDNGLGNGDQKAPGRSLARNRAENQVGNPGHKSGKPQNSD
jgi:hypothetical protein